MSTGERERLLQALRELGREHSNALIMFHGVLSEKMGVTATEEKTLDLLERNGPLTAGELSHLTGLAPASITGLVDRLARKGFVRRTRDEADGRRVLVEINQEHVASFADLFKDLADRFEKLYAGYTDDELALIYEHLQKSRDILGESTLALSDVSRNAT